MDLAALRAYAAAAEQVGSASGPAMGGEHGVAPAGAPDFTNMVQDALGSVEATVQNAENLTAQAAVGQAEMVDVVTAVAAAEVQLETVIAVRDQVIRAYQEIMRMPI